MWQLFDYQNASGENEILNWCRDELQKRERGKLQSKLDMLQENGGDLPPGLLIKTEVEYIYKLKVQGNPKLRPMICKGIFRVLDPITGQERDEEAFTILVGAKEISWEFEPKGADTEAAIRRRAIIQDPKRRTKHVRIT